MTESHLLTCSQGLGLVLFVLLYLSEFQDLFECGRAYSLSRISSAHSASALERMRSEGGSVSLYRVSVGWWVGGWVGGWVRHKCRQGSNMPAAWWRRCRWANDKLASLFARKYLQKGI